MRVGFSSPPRAAEVSGTPTHLGCRPHQLWAIFLTLSCEGGYRHAGTGERRGAALELADLAIRGGKAGFSFRGGREGLRESPYSRLQKGHRSVISSLLPRCLCHLPVLNSNLVCVSVKQRCSVKTCICHDHRRCLGNTFVILEKHALLHQCIPSSIYLTC